MGLLLPPSFFLFLFMHFVVLLLVGSVPDSVHYGNETDRQALLAFKAEITGDPLGTLNSWNESVHFCQWVGVTCGRRHQRVTWLILNHAKLTGPISPHIGNLSFLMRLELKNNSLSHNIPQQIGNLRRLKLMSLLNNSVTGEIPANISRCSNLISLEFTFNRLTGKIPTKLGDLSKLQKLYIAANNLTGGVPVTIEYGMGNQVSTSGDMYSFGILLLEMFTGKRPTDTMFEGSLTLHSFVEMAMAEQVANIADPTLFQQVAMGETSSSIKSTQNQTPASIHEVRECLTSILKVGIACSEELPRDRPDIKEIISQLHVIKNTLLGVGVHGGMRARIAA